MNRLESFISRVAAQRDILVYVCRDVGEMDGLILEPVSETDGPKTIRVCSWDCWPFSAR